MENIKLSKIKIDRALHARMEAHETELRDLIQAGCGTPTIRYALDIIQERLANTEVEETWADPTPPGAA